jgi:hypothetical protein
LVRAAAAGLRKAGELQYIYCIVWRLQRIRHSPPELARLIQSSSDLLTFTMGQLGIVVPFTVFTEYRDRRSSGGTIAVTKPDVARPPVHRSAEGESGSGEAAEAGDNSGCADTTFTSAETIVPAEPTPERIPS